MWAGASGKSGSIVSLQIVSCTRGVIFVYLIDTIFKFQIQLFFIGETQEAVLYFNATGEVYMGCTSNLHVMNLQP